MIKTNAKVIIDEEDAKVVISILPNPSGAQKTILILWVLLWFLTGVAVMAYYPSTSDDARIMLIVYLSFWAYFLYTALRGLLWNLWGAEYLKVENGELSYKRSWRGYGKVTVYDGQTIKEFGILNLEDKSFARSYGEAFWTLGGEKLGFEYIGRKVVFGMKLSQGDARRVAQRIGHALKSKSKQ